MNKLARILLVEREADLRRDLDRHLEHAGHEVAAVADSEAARGLVREGLLPDVVVADAAQPEEERILREILPDAAHLRIVHDRDADGENADGDDDPAYCSSDPGEILRRIEEVLFNHAPVPGYDDASRCMDLARRLANSLPKTRTAEERIDLLTDGFDAFFHVQGTLVVRRGPANEWIEVRQGLAADLAEQISQEIARRTQHRGLRPFLTEIETTDGVHQVACLPVQVADVETDLAMALERAPAEPTHRESLMNLVGGGMRTAMNEEAADDTRSLLEAQVSSFESLLNMSREFAGIGSRPSLCVAMLRALQRELRMTRSALFVARDDDCGLLDLQATRGFSASLLERIGLSGFHGVGAECLRDSGMRRLSTFASDGLATRELRLLSEASLRWAVPFNRDGQTPGVLLFGCPDDSDPLLAADRQVLNALLEAAAVAFGGLDRLETLQDLSVRSLRGLVAAIEMHCPQSRGHSERVARNAIRVGRAMSMTPTELRDLAVAALLHDVGKVAPGDPEAVDDPAGSAERRHRAHPVNGSQILSRAKPVAAVIQAVEQHHERWDGFGFPYGLREEGIQLTARILAVANAYDHFQSGDASPTAVGDALRRLERGAGLLWDPGVVALFVAEVGAGAPARDAPDDDRWLEEVLTAI